MAERQVDSTVDLEKLFPNTDLRSRAELFIKGVCDVVGVNELILRRFRDSTLRFYVIWSEETGDRVTVRNMWEQNFSDCKRNSADLLLIQYSQEEFRQIEAESKHMQMAEKFVLWTRPEA